MTHTFKTLSAAAALTAVTSLSAIAGGSTVATGPTTPPPSTTATETEGGTVAAVTDAYLRDTSCEGSWPSVAGCD